MLHIDRVSWHPEPAIRDVDRAARDAEDRAGEHLLEAASSRVPRATGFLEESGTVSRVEEGVVVSYSAPYAPVLRAHPEWDYQNDRSGRWFDEAIDQEADAIGGLITDTVRAEWPG